MCGAPTQEGLAPLTAEQLADQAVVQGVVRSGGTGVAGAYARLLDADGEFVAEVQTSATGHFRFFAAPGEWSVSVLARGGAKGAATVTAHRGVASEVEVELGS